MLASVFQEAGYKVGLYTSPHLKDFRERIKINGKEIPENDVVDFIIGNKAFLEENKLSFFEMTVGMAFHHFASQKIDIAIVEVGLGGRLDSTNIVNPELSIITNIGYDHTQLLGNTLGEIAFEKAGIIKKGVPVVIGESQRETTPVFLAVAERNTAEIIFASERAFEREYESDLKGGYQKNNIKTVITAIDLLRKDWNITEESIRKGLLEVRKNTGLRGRWDVLQTNPRVICDTAHNAEGLRWVIDQLLKEDYKELHIVLGVVNDKDLNKIMPLFPKEARYYFCKPNVPRGMDAKILKTAAADYGLKGELKYSVSKAYDSALAAASAGDVIYVGGSTFTVAEII